MPEETERNDEGGCPIDCPPSGDQCAGGDLRRAVRAPVGLQHRQCGAADHPARTGFRPRRLAVGGDGLCPHVWVLAPVGWASLRPAGATPLALAGPLALWPGLADLRPAAPPAPAHP